MKEKRADYPDRLSGGQPQRVAVVRAPALRRLGLGRAADVLDVIRELTEGRITMLIATHEMEPVRLR